MKKLSIKSILSSLLAIFTLFLLGSLWTKYKKGYLQLINQDKKTDSFRLLEYQGDKILSTDSTLYLLRRNRSYRKEQLKEVIDEYDENSKMSKDSHILLNIRMTMSLKNKD